MADVINRLSREYKRSVNTPEYPLADWIINPDLSSVAGVPWKYWKIVGDSVLPMTQEERDIVDAPQPRTELYPFELLSLLTSSQVVAVQTSFDPLVILLRSKLQTIVTPMPFVDGSEVYEAIEYLGMTMPQEFTEAEVQRILRGEVPSGE
jgi:hypothetical protein